MTQCLHALIVQCYQKSRLHLHLQIDRLAVDAVILFAR